jgi:hypothetical protein
MRSAPLASRRAVSVPRAADANACASGSSGSAVAPPDGRRRRREAREQADECGSLPDDHAHFFDVALLVCAELTLPQEIHREGERRHRVAQLVRGESRHFCEPSGRVGCRVAMHEVTFSKTFPEVRARMERIRLGLIGIPP